MSKIRAEQEGWSKRADIRYPHWRQEKSQWIVVENAHEPLVEKEIWLKANSFGNLKKYTQTKHAAPYLLSGLIICAKCSFIFQGQTVGSKGKRYHQYICGGYNAKRVCEYFRLPRDPLEKFVMSCLRESLSSSSVIEKVRELLTSMLNLAPKQKQSVMHDLELKLRQIEEKQNGIIKAIEERSASGNS